jgi:hypothetical protein
VQDQSLEEVEKLRQDPNLYQNGGGVRRDGGACGGDAALHDGGVVRAMFRAGYAGANVGRGVGNVGENGTGLRALDAADEEAGQSVVAAGGYASADEDVGANDGGWVSGQSVGFGIDLFPCRVHSSRSDPSLLCAARPQHPNPCLQQAWDPKQDIRVPC